MDIKHLYTSIDGRIGRQQFWFGVIPLIIVGMIASFINPVAGFVVAICGEIMTMPGLPRNPSSEKIFLNDMGYIEGLF